MIDKVTFSLSLFRLSSSKEENGNFVSIKHRISWPKTPLRCWGRVKRVVQRGRVWKENNMRSCGASAIQINSLIDEKTRFLFCINYWIEWYWTESESDFHHSIDLIDYALRAIWSRKRSSWKRWAFDRSDLLLLLLLSSISSFLVLLLLLPAQDQSELLGRCLLWFYLFKMPLLDHFSSLILTLFKHQVANNYTGYILPVPKCISFSFYFKKLERSNQSNEQSIYSY